MKQLFARYPALWLITGLILSALLQSLFASQAIGMQISFRNDSDVMIQSIKLDFGNANGQSSLLTLRIAPGETRPMLLNHQPGMGFNVKVNYADGRQQSFCALKGDPARERTLPLQP